MFARLLPALLLAGCAATPTPDAVSMPSLAAANLSGASFSESCEDWDEWDKAAPPFRILGNSWYVGTCGIAAILVASPQGHVLIDSGTEAGGELILANLRRIGVDPEDVRYILATNISIMSVGMQFSPRRPVHRLSPRPAQPLFSKAGWFRMRTHRRMPVIRLWRL